MKNEQKEKGEELATEMARLVNYSSGDGSKAFIDKMSREHRTLQQSFTRMCLEWLEQVAEKEGPQFVDPRNADSQKTATRIMKGFVRIIAEEQNISENEVIKNWEIYKPSKWLRFI